MGRSIVYTEYMKRKMYSETNLTILIGLTLLTGWYNLYNWYQMSDLRFRSPVVEVKTPISLIKEVKAEEVSDKGTEEHTRPHQMPEKVDESEKWTPILSDKEVALIIKSYGWDYETAIRLAKSENYWNLTHSFDCARRNDNSDGSYDIGLFQINSIHLPTLQRVYGWTMEDMKDCTKNAQFAYEWLYVHQGWNPWVAFKNGSYLNHSIISL